MSKSDSTGMGKLTINEWHNAWVPLNISFTALSSTRIHTRAQSCLFTITTPPTRCNNAECVKALHSESRTKPIFVSQLALPPDWAAPLCETSHRKTQPLRMQRAALMCKCMQEIFRKAKITEPNEVAALKLLGLWIITTRFLELSSISRETMTSVA